MKLYIKNTMMFLIIQWNVKQWWCNVFVVNLDPIDEKLLEEEPIGLTDQKR